MKKIFFLILILGILFIFGVLIYDFGDEMNPILTNHKWYTSLNNEIYELTLNNDNFQFQKENGEIATEYQNCTNLHYNNNVSIIKMKCGEETKKIYISNFNENKLSLNEDGKEKVFYSSKDLALIEDFKNQNDLSDFEYNELISINFNNNLYISYKKLNELYKSKKIVYIGFITNNINYENVYNYQVLNKLINNSSKEFYLLNINNLNNEELTKLNKLTKIKDYNNKINIYEVGNKKIKSKVLIDTTNVKDLNNYKNI